MEDTYFMDEALALAREAAADGEVPVGCGDRPGGTTIVGRGRNRRETDKSASPRGDRSHRGSMPAFGRLASVGVYPVRDAGTLPHVCRGHYQRPHPPGGLRCFRPEVRRCGFGVQSVSMEFNHHPQVESGVREAECGALLTEFFRNLRMELRSRPRWKPGNNQ